MSVALRPMTDAEIESFLAMSRTGHIADLVWTGIDEELAAASTDQGITLMFPDGKPAEGHFAFRVEEDGRPVGWLWLGPSSQPGPWSVWDIIIDESERGRGLGTQTMLLAEEEARSCGATEMTLNVYAYNANARHVYEKIGYEATATQMRKKL